MRKASQFQMMVWTFVAVAVTGVAVMFSLLTPPASVRAARLLAEQKKIAASEPLVETSDRSPASVQTQFSANPIDNHGQQALDFTLPCDGSTKFSKSVVQVRLIGSLCGPTSRKAVKREIASTEIRNEANGFSATVFPAGKNKFTTDYMSLAPGSNRIRILHVFKQGGKEERDFVIERSM